MKERKAASAAKALTVCAALCSLLFLTACGARLKDAVFNSALFKYKESPAMQSAQATLQESGFRVYEPDEYDSEDTTAVIMELDEKAKTVTLFNRAAGKSYTLSYDGTTRFFDKYGNGITVASLSAGLVTDTTFIKSNKHMNTLMISPEAWTYSDLTRYTINPARKSIKIADAEYRYGSDLLVISEGRRAELMDVNPVDSLSVRGLGHDVLSLTIDKGHGYLRLLNDEYFVGGWISVGQGMMSRITEDMLLAVPEGSYTVRVSHNGNGGEKQVKIRRNEEVKLDVGDLEVEEIKQGSIIFTAEPADAVIVVDGEKADTSAPVKLEYGLHQLIASAEGYDTLTQYIRVNAEAANIHVILEKTKDASETEAGAGYTPYPPSYPTVSGNSAAEAGTVSGNASDTSSMTASNDAITYISEAQGETASNHRIRLEAPEGVEAYVDGSYIGILPIDFAKVAGSHVITLRKDGYRTRSYTIEVDSSEKDISFSFADLSPTSQ